jgi:hypothetical protein
MKLNKILLSILFINLTSHGMYNNAKFNISNIVPLDFSHVRINDKKIDRINDISRGDMKDVLEIQNLSCNQMILGLASRISEIFRQKESSQDNEFAVYKTNFCNNDYNIIAFYTGTTYLISLIDVKDNKCIFFSSDNKNRYVFSEEFFANHKISEIIQTMKAERFNGGIQLSFLKADRSVFYCLTDGRFKISTLTRDSGYNSTATSNMMQGTIMEASKFKTLFIDLDNKNSPIGDLKIEEEDEQQKRQEAQKALEERKRLEQNNLQAQKALEEPKRLEQEVLEAKNYLEEESKKIEQKYLEPQKALEEPKRLEQNNLQKQMKPHSDFFEFREIFGSKFIFEVLNNERYNLIEVDNLNKEKESFYEDEIILPIEQICFNKIPTRFNIIRYGCHPLIEKLEEFEIRDIVIKFDQTNNILAFCIRYKNQDKRTNHKVIFRQLNEGEKLDYSLEGIKSGKISLEIALYNFAIDIIIGNLLFTLYVGDNGLMIGTIKINEKFIRRALDIRKDGTLCIIEYSKDFHDNNHEKRFEIKIDDIQKQLKNIELE